MAKKNAFVIIKFISKLIIISNIPPIPQFFIISTNNKLFLFIDYLS